MAVTFVIGRAGSGKTWHCAQRIAGSLRTEPLGERIYWLLPKQATFIAERELACGMGLPGFCRARVLSFDQLATDIFNDCGGSSIPQITALGRQMALGHLLRKHENDLRFFRSVARQPGLAAELDATLTELDRCGQDPAQILAAMERGKRTGTRFASTGDAESIALLDKLADLELLSGAYTAFLGQERLDQHRRLEHVLKSIDTCSFMAGAAFYVDGFSEFTDFERKILVGIGRSAGSLDITLAIDPNSPTVGNYRSLPLEMSVFHRTEMTYHRLRLAMESATVPVQVALLDSPRRFTSPATLKVEAECFSAADGSAEPTDRGGLTMVEAPSRAAEVDAAAREIGRLVAEEGLRYRDIAVMVRSTEPYLSLIDAAFAEHRIPWFADRRRTAGHHPLLQLLRALFQIVRFNWPNDAVLSMLKGGLAGVDGASADAIENYVLRHGLLGSAWTSAEPWNYQQGIVPGEDADDAAVADVDSTAAAIEAQRRRLVEAIRPFAEALGEPRLTVRRIASETFACLERLGARQELQRWMEGATAAEQFEQAGEHEQVWAKLVDLFQEMVELLGGERVSLDDFVVILDSGLEQFDLALAPATVDQVLIGQVDRTHTPAIKACLVLGLSKGEFPAVARDPTVLTDRERRSLDKQLIELSPGTRRKQLDEFFLGYLAFTRASQWLWVSRPRSLDGREATPSQFWHRLRQLFPSLPVQSAAEPGRIDADAIATPRQLITGVMRWARQDESSPPPWPAEEADALWPALYTLLADHPRKDDAIDIMRFRAWKALAYDNSARLPMSAANRLFRRPLSASISQLESFAACPFQHFVRFGLRLKSRFDRQIDAGDLSNAYHDLLHRLIRAAIEHAAKRGEQAGPITPETVRIETDRFTRQLARGLFTGNGRNAYLLRRIERTIIRIIASQQAVLARGTLHPAESDVRFGLGGRYPALRVSTPGGAEVHVHGRIDRIDVAGESAAAIDYRLTARGLDAEAAYHGISLRILAHLLAVDACFPTKEGKAVSAIAALELSLSRRFQSVQDPAAAADPDSPEFLLAQPPKGIVASGAAREFDSGWTSGKSPVLQANIKKDGSPGAAGSLMNEDRMADLLRFAWKTIGELGDGVLGGRIDVHPYRLRNQSPCAHCEFRSVCRFELTVNRYRSLPIIETDRLWEQIEAKAADDA